MSLRGDQSHAKTKEMQTCMFLAADAEIHAVRAMLFECDNALYR